MANKVQPYNHKVSSLFSPSWCLRPPATKDSLLGNNKKKSKSVSLSLTYTTEPSSPRVGCLGQVRRRKASSSAPPPQTSDTSHLNFHGQFNFLLIKQVISSKIVFREMDPPRPVEKTEARGEGSVNLWKRRCREGEALKLQLQLLIEQACTKDE